MNKITKKVEETYEYLVDLTDNHEVLHDKVLNDRLQKMLEFCEYLLDREEENPVMFWFWGTEDED